MKQFFRNNGLLILIAAVLLATRLAAPLLRSTRDERTISTPFRDCRRLHPRRYSSGTPFFSAA